MTFYFWFPGQCSTPTLTARLTMGAAPSGIWAGAGTSTSRCLYPGFVQTLKRKKHDRGFLQQRFWPHNREGGRDNCRTSKIFLHKYNDEQSKRAFPWNTGKGAMYRILTARPSSWGMFPKKIRWNWEIHTGCTLLMIKSWLTIVLFPWNSGTQTPCLDLEMFGWVNCLTLVTWPLGNVSPVIVGLWLQRWSLILTSCQECMLGRWVFRIHWSGKGISWYCGLAGFL